MNKNAKVLFKPLKKTPSNSSRTKFPISWNAKRRWIITIILLIFVAFMGILLPRILFDKEFGDSFLMALGMTKRTQWILHGAKEVKSAESGRCLSIRESASYYQDLVPAPSLPLVKALRMQEKLQKNCVNGIRNWKKHLSRPNKGFESCKYIIWEEDGNGLGNKFLSISSAFVYALLTNRVLLIHSNYLHLLLCSPFPRTSWWLHYTQNMTLITPLTSMLRNLKDKKKPNRVKIVLQHNYLTKENMDHFFCEYVQDELKDVRWLIYFSSQYVIPAFFTIPSFAKKLQRLFPHGLVIPYVARYLFHPSNPLWERITRLYQVYYSHSNLKVGIQIRTAGNYNRNISQSIFECINGSGVLPPLMSQAEYRIYLKHRIQLYRTSSTLPKYVISMFVASLNIGYFDYLKSIYFKMPVSDESTILLHFGSHNNMEVHNLEKDKSALVEIWLLSMSDVLFQSKWSTFGYMAKALGNQKSYFMDTDWGLTDQSEKIGSVCELSKSSEPCFHVFPSNLSCSPKTILYFKNWKPRLDVCQDYTLGMAIFPDIKESDG